MGPRFTYQGDGSSGEASNAGNAGKRTKTLKVWVAGLVKPVKAKVEKKLERQKAKAEPEAKAEPRVTEMPLARVG
jgi:hypothetical protein